MSARHIDRAGDLDQFGAGTILVDRTGNAWQVADSDPIYRSINAVTAASGDELVHWHGPLYVLRAVARATPLAAAGCDESAAHDFDLGAHEHAPYRPLLRQLVTLQARNAPGSAAWNAWDGVIGQWNAIHPEQASLERVVTVLERDITRLRRLAVRAGWATRTTDVPDHPHIGDTAELRIESPDVQFTVTWELVSGQRGTRRTATITSKGQTARRLSVADLERRLTAAPAMQPPGMCRCCNRTPPPEAGLTRTNAGLCFACDTWHGSHSTALVAPDPACEHTTATASVPAGWRSWRADSRTEPFEDTDGWTRWARLRLDAAGVGTYTLRAASPELGQAYIAREPGGHVMAYRSTADHDGVRLRDDLARHEVSLVLQALTERGQVPASLVA